MWKKKGGRHKREVEESDEDRSKKWGIISKREKEKGEVPQKKGIQIDRWGRNKIFVTEM